MAGLDDVDTVGREGDDAVLVSEADVFAGTEALDEDAETLGFTVVVFLTILGPSIKGIFRVQLNPS